jgi:hypothetical protein
MLAGRPNNFVDLIERQAPEGSPTHFDVPGTGR